MSNIFNDMINNEDFFNGNTEVFTEAVFPETLPYLKVLQRTVNLPYGEPTGRGNICFLYTSTFKDSIKLMTKRSNFIDNSHKYKCYYYNKFYHGKIINKIFRIKDINKQKEYYKYIKDSKIHIIPKLRIGTNENDNMNLYYDLHRYINIFNSLTVKIRPLRYIDLYWTYMMKIFNIQIKGYKNKFVLVDLSAYDELNKSIQDNLFNPIYIIYYTALRKPELLKNVNIDFYFFNKNKVMKINPSTLNDKSFHEIKSLMKRIMPYNVKNIDHITDEVIIRQDEIARDSSEKLMSVIPSNNEVVTIKNTNELDAANKLTDIEKEIKIKADNKVAKVATVIKKTDDSHKEQISNAVTASIQKELDQDRAVITKLYRETKKDVPTKSAASTARDELLREEQKKIVVEGMTIEEIQKINANKIPIPTTDVSKNVKTTNKNISEIRFANLDKTYNEKLLKKDITGAILSLNDKSIPMYVLKIDIEDTSDELNYKDTYTILLEDGNRKRHTIKVDIPKFIDDKFLYIGGNKKIIKHQNFFLPVVKIRPEMVQIVTNYSKMTISRIGNKSISSIERLKKLVSENDDAKKYFKIGNCYPNNINHITTIEYDDLSKNFLEFKSGKTFIIFDQGLAKEYMDKHEIKEKPKKMFIGLYKGENCYIDIDSQISEKGDTIAEIILDSLIDELGNIYEKIKLPKRLMYADVRIMGQALTVGMLLGFWEGLSSLLKKMGTEYRIENRVPSSLPPNESYIRFKDGILVYKDDVPTSLILNGIRNFKTENYEIASFDEKEPYLDYIKKVYGKAIIENALMNFYEFAIDNITLEILKDLDMPTDIVNLYIYAIKLLADSQYTPEINQNLSRIRCNEIIPGILYERLAKNYVTYRNNNGRKKFSVPQDCVIKELLGLKTVEDYSTLNPTLEMDMLHAVSVKGFIGVNLEQAFTVPKRSYDPSMIGVISPSTSPDGQVGISNKLTLEPKIKSLRGYTEDNHESLDKVNDVNLFSPAEMSMPLGATIDDPNRLGHAVKQSSHVIPVKNSSPVLISNGLEEVARFHLSSNFVVNAEEDGEIVDYDEKSKMLIAKYKSGKCRAIDLNPNIVKNGGGGFYLSNILHTDLKVGDKFKKNDVLAFHKDFFKNDKFNNCRMTMGTLSKVAIMSTYNTYEDSTMITHHLSERASTEMCFCKSAVVGKNSNVFYMVEKGQEINVGDPLIQFDTSFEDESINELLAALGEKEKENVLEGARNEVKSKYGGVIEDIKIYPTVDLDEMSPSLRKIVNGYYRSINHKKDFLDKYDEESKNSIVKCGVLVNQPSHKIKPNKFGVIKGEHVEDSVLIEFYIKHSEPLEIGSKIANFTALKNTIGEIIPEGYEPWSEYHTDEPIDTIIASNSILNRMTPSIFLTSLGYKNIIELKNKLKELNFNREKMESLIYRFFTAFDKTGANTKKYKALFQPMSDAQFKNYFTEFFKNENAFLILDVVDYERTINIEDIERAAKVLGIPLYEYVYLPHLTMDKSHVVCTKEKVPVGYICIKRTQQTVMKKNGISIDINERSALTGQVTGHDKNGRESDLENIMLVSLGMKNTLKELNSARADDNVMKEQMLHDIALNGYTKLSDMDDNIENKTTLNTVNTYMLGMSINSDLVTKGLMLPTTLKKEL